MTPQTQAIAGANEIAQAMQRMYTQYLSLSDISAREEQQGWLDILAQLPTAAMNADGSLGTADSSPVTGNPIDTRVVTGLNVTLPATDYVSALAFMGSMLSVGTDSIAAGSPFLGSGS